MSNYVLLQPVPGLEFMQSAATAVLFAAALWIAWHFVLFLFHSFHV